jgi:hypothetical protein
VEIATSLLSLIGKNEREETIRSFLGGAVFLTAKYGKPSADYQFIATSSG